MREGVVGRAEEGVSELGLRCVMGLEEPVGTIELVKEVVLVLVSSAGLLG